MHPSASAAPRRAAALALAVLGALAAALPAGAAEPDAGAAPAAAAMAAEASALLRQAAGAAVPAGRFRIEVEPGQLDPRLRLAPCARIEPYLPAGARPWGRTRVGLRCVQGPAPWNVFLPVTVRVLAPAWVARGPLAAGTELRAEHLEQAEADWAAESSPVLADLQALQGRTLAQPLAAGTALRQAHLRARQWFAAGATVRVHARGAGFAVATEGQALGHGLDGQAVRVRLDSGRVLVGQAVGERLVELAL